MRKSNWIIIAIIIVASIIFLGMWFYFGFNYVDDPLDLVLTIIWWLLVIAICIGIHKAEKARCKSIRTMFLGVNAIFNSELGILALGGDGRYVPVMKKALADLEYGFHREDLPTDENERIGFRYIVSTDKFKSDGQTWEGEVIEVADANHPRAFHSMEELSGLVDANR